jgi:peroxiredoxin
LTLDPSLLQCYVDPPDAVRRRGALPRERFSSMKRSGRFWFPLMHLAPCPITERRPPELRIGDTAPLFRARATLGEVSLDQYRGRWLVFFSHPADFTPVCTSEFVALARAASQFEAMKCSLLGLSVDSLYAHIAWVRPIQEMFDVTVSFPIVEDPSRASGPLTACWTRRHRIRLLSGRVILSIRRGQSAP